MICPRGESLPIPAAPLVPCTASPATSLRSRISGALRAVSPVHVALPRADLEHVQDVDPRASVRVFHATQIVFPRYATAATVLIRVFPAGSSIAFQASLTTLGPPEASLEDFLSQRSRHKLEEERPIFSREPSKEKSPAARDGFEYLNQADLANRSGPLFQNHVDIGDLKKLDLCDEQRRGMEYDKFFQEIIDDSLLWPGRVIETLANLREQRSRILPADFFGRPDMIAHIHTVYDQIVRCTLEKIDEGGFDISPYRDANGQILIQTGKIEQLIVGEKVTMTKESQNSQQDKRPEAPKQQAA